MRIIIEKGKQIRISKSIALFFMLILSIHSFAQKLSTTVTTQVGNPTSSYLEYYFSPISTLFSGTIVFNDFNEPSWDVKLQVTIESNSLKIESQLNNSVPAIEVFPGVPYHYDGKDLTNLMGYQNLNVQGITLQDLTTNGRLPDGYYQFCVQAFDAKTLTPLSHLSCTPVTIQSLDEPTTITPFCGSVQQVSPNQNIAFQWQPSNGTLQGSELEYILTLYEITDNTVNPSYAIQNNKVLKVYTSPEQNQNTLIYNMTMPLLDIGKTYAYTVQQIDPTGKETFKNNGISQPCWFYYGYPIGGTIALISPANLSGFALGQDLYFQWSSPNILLSGQQVSYQLKVVELANGQDPSEAIVDNPAWYTETTPPTSLTNGYNTLIPQKLTPQANYAWQVTGWTNGIQVAQSPVYTFIGPGVISSFMAGMHEVTVKTTSNTDLTNLSGTGEFRISQSGATQQITFSNLNIIQVAGLNVLNAGTITGNLTDTTAITLAPLNEVNGNAYFHPSQFQLDKNSLQIYGNITWAFPHLVTSSAQAYVVTSPSWVNFDSYYPQGNSILNGTNQFSLLDPYNFNLNLFTTSDFLLTQNKYQLRIDGELVLPQSVKGTSLTAGRVSFPFRQVDQLYYFSVSGSLSNNILPLQNTNLEIQPTAYTIDLDETQSPLLIGQDLDWKGVYFNNFNAYYHSNIDLFNQVVLSNDINTPYTLSGGSPYKGWVNSDGLTLNIAQNLSGQKATFNSFSSNLTTFNLNMDESSVRSGSLTGAMYIPFISTTNQFTFTAPIGNLGIQGGYMDSSLINSKFTFNPTSSQQAVDITIQSAVFADMQRLEFVLDANWQYLGVSLSSITGFKAWGNYNIGFLQPNGTMSLSTQAEGHLSSYPAIFTGIGAGNSDGAYSFGLTGNAILSSDVSGANGPPAINLYSTVPNSFLPPATAGSSSLSDTSSGNTSVIPANTASDSIGAATTAIQNYLVNQLQQLSAGNSSNTNLLVDTTAKSYSSNEIYTSSTTSNSSGDSSYAQFNIDVNTQQFLKNLTTQVVNYLTRPLMQKINAEALTISNKITAQINTAVNNAIQTINPKIYSLVDSLALHIAESIKKDSIDISGQLKPIADSIAAKVTADVDNLIISTVANNVTMPITNTISYEIPNSINQSIVNSATTIIGGFYLNHDYSISKMESDLSGDLSSLIDNIGSAVLGNVNLQKMESSVNKTGIDAYNNINTGNILSLLEQAIINKAGKIASNVVSNMASQALTNAISSISPGAVAGVGIQMNFHNLGRNLEEGKVGNIIKLDAVSVALNTKFVSFAGTVLYIPSDPVYGDVWEGAVSFNVKVPKPFGLSGQYIHGRKNNFNYWFCEITGSGGSGGNVTPAHGGVMPEGTKPLSQPVPLGIVNLMAASGRLYSHMNDQQGQPIVPDSTINYGAFMEFVFFDGANKGKSMRLDVAAGIQVAEDGDYQIEFSGDLELGNVNPQILTIDPNAMGAGGVSINYNSAESHFIGDAWIKIQKTGTLCASGSLHVDVKPGAWSVQLGTSQNRLVFVPACAGFSPTGWLDVSQSDADLGLGLQASFYAVANFEFVEVGVNASLAVGIDADVQYNPSFALNSLGIWLQLYADVFVAYNIPLVAHGSVNLAQIYIQGNVTMTFHPSPSNLDGQVNGHVSLCGIFNSDFSAGFHKDLG